MKYLFDELLADEVFKRAVQCQHRAFVATAYCKDEAFLEKLADPTRGVVDKRIIVRWRLEDLVTGASDLEVYRIANDCGWAMYLEQDLHAKVFVLDYTAIVGSANLTNAGFRRFVSGGNHESAVSMVCDESIENWFNQMFGIAQRLDDVLFEAICEDVERIRSLQTIDSTVIQYSDNVQQLWKEQPVRGLYTEDLLWSEGANEILSEGVAEGSARNRAHDLKVLRLRYPISEERLRQTFLESRAFRWLYDTLEEEKEAFFGSLSQKLHTDLLDDPAPYRKTVKQLLNNLLEWARVFGADVLEIDVPNHSTRVRRVGPLKRNDQDPEL